jgi:hypothetical protein
MVLGVPLNSMCAIGRGNGRQLLLSTTNTGSVISMSVSSNNELRYNKTYCLGKRPFVLPLSGEEEDHIVSSDRCFQLIMTDQTSINSNLEFNRVYPPQEKDLIAIVTIDEKDGVMAGVCGTSGELILWKKTMRRKHGEKNFFSMHR